MNLKTALRDSETATRPYVIVNPLLAKHLPVPPGAAFEYFSRLGKMAAETCIGEKVLVIGFAETATAVGMAVAAEIDGAVYVHTTREEQPEEGLVSEFLEEHSHAKNQALYLRKEFGDISGYDRLVFVEDEITTGKTILNFLKTISYSGKITISALVFNEFNPAVFAAYDARFCCVEQIEAVRRIKAPNLPSPRSGVSAQRYLESCRAAAVDVTSRIDPEDIAGKNVLVLGTEEFMYPALVLGEALEKAAGSIKTHSTTRSPLLPKPDEGYPFKMRASFTSPYDSERTTFLYNLEKYDTVIIYTDAKSEPPSELLLELRLRGNLRIYYARVKDED